MGSNLPIFATSLVALWKYRELLGELKMLIGYFHFSSLIQFVSMLLWLNSKNNMPLLHIYVPIGTGLLLAYYQETLDMYLRGKLLHWIGVAFAVVCIANTLFVQDLYSFCSNTLTIQCILLAIVSIAIFILLLNPMVKKSDRSMKTLSWINSGVLVYFSSCLILFYFGDMLVELATLEFRFNWVLHAIFISVFYGFNMMGLWTYLRK